MREIRQNTRAHHTDSPFVFSLPGLIRNTFLRKREKKKWNYTTAILILLSISFALALFWIFALIIVARRARVFHSTDRNNCGQRNASLFLLFYFSSFTRFTHKRPTKKSTPHFRCKQTFSTHFLLLFTMNNEFYPCTLVFVISHNSARYNFLWFFSPSSLVVWVKEREKNFSFCLRVMMASQLIIFYSLGKLFFVCLLMNLFNRHSEINRKFLYLPFILLLKFTFLFFFLYCLWCCINQSQKNVYAYGNSFKVSTKNVCGFSFTGAIKVWRRTCFGIKPKTELEFTERA